MIEIIATSLEDAKTIEGSGADRIELVSAFSEGGITPSYGLIKKVVESVTTPVNVMVRPHSKSFVYSEEDIKIMQEDIAITKKLGANGVVLGALNSDGMICIKTLERLLEVCDGLQVTFHRAVDELKDPADGIKLLSNYIQITNVLTSGGKGSITDNIGVIRKMVSYSKHINVLVGGGLNFDNIEEITRRTGAPQYHFGTAVRKNCMTNGEIEHHKLEKLIRLMHKY